MRNKQNCKRRTTLLKCGRTQEFLNAVRTKKCGQKIFKGGLNFFFMQTTFYFCGEIFKIYRDRMLLIFYSRTSKNI